jgi:DNA/RNA endonuclease G (NUC1)
VYTEKKVTGTTRKYKGSTGVIFTGKACLYARLGEKRKTIVPVGLWRVIVTYLKSTIYV